ncbi:MAG: carboxypeptidase-like regulatory domain-containing protein [Bacteroidales bacterium]|nr:carboxypeptidase-like regulatory domain-containing protein [Bacteroidales bacterium]
MRKHIIQAALVAAFFLAPAAALADIIVTGQVIDAENNEPLVGVSVALKGTTQGTTTDENGFFTLKSPANKGTIHLSYIGYNTNDITINRAGHHDLGQISLGVSTVSLGAAVVTANAIERKTPVAVTSVTADEIELKLGTQEFVEILKETPGVHANKQGGGWGDSEIYMRGFDNTNVATMVNGVPMNDMENGTVYWSNWAGIGDVTRMMQTQRGLGASKVSAPSVGGTINIVTKSLDEHRGGSASYAIGSDGMNKVSLALSSGNLGHDWYFNVLGSRTWGDGYVQGTGFNGSTWFVNLAKKFGDAHVLSFTGFGTIQEHGQRVSSANYGPLTIAEWARVSAQYGDKGYRYNPTFGYFHGQAYNSVINKYHKPQLSLNHEWKINSSSNLNTALYMSIGRGSGATAEGHGAGAYSDYYGASNGQVKSEFRTADGLYDYDALYERNAASDEGSVLAFCRSVNNHFWTGLLSTYTNHLNDHLDFYGGLDFRYYRGDHSTEITDLFGGGYFMDDQDRGSVSAANNAAAANPAWAYQKLSVGDIVYRDYSGYVVQEGVFGQLEYNLDGLSTYVNGAINNTSYWKRDRFYYDAEHERSKTGNYLGGNIKAGANYNIDVNNNVFLNAGYISRAPKFNGAFMNSTTSNYLNTDARNEKIVSVEAGYGWHSTWANIKANVYYTNWLDKTMTKYLTLNNQETGYMNMTGVNARHMGVEVEGKFRPATWVEIKAMLSLGDWQWAGIGEGYVYNEHSQAVNPDGMVVEPFSAEHAQARVDLDGIRVGGSAQTTASAGIEFKPTKALRFGADWTYYGRNYSYYSLSGSNITVKQNATTGEWTTTTPAEPWKIPSAYQFDLHASYRFHLGDKVNAVLSGNVNNLLDNHYIGKAYNSSTASSAPTADNVYVFYQFGRTYSLRLKLNF